MLYVVSAINFKDRTLEFPARECPKFACENDLADYLSKHDGWTSVVVTILP